MSGDLKRFVCLGCGFLYDEALGLPEHGIAPGTRWADVPENWACPDCFTPKHRFENHSYNIISATVVRDAFRQHLTHGEQHER